MNIVSVDRGSSPLILTQPHGGTHIPDEILDKLNEKGKAIADTDWHINKLYDGLVDDVTVVKSHIHRYVIDANRGPEDESLYPGQNTTGLCPLTDFDGNSIYKPGQQPSNTEIKSRQLRFHQPYHDAIAKEIQRLLSIHKYIILYDCHSIRSMIPYLFEGTLPDFNIGTFNEQSCNLKIQQVVKDICNQAQDYSSIVNGRFKGGWTTRHYGQPDKGIHAIQMELAQLTYMQEEAPWTFQADKANALRHHLKEILQTIQTNEILNK